MEYEFFKAGDKVRLNKENEYLYSFSKYIDTLDDYEEVDDSIRCLQANGIYYFTINTCHVVNGSIDEGAIGFIETGRHVYPIEWFEKIDLLDVI